MNNEQIFTNNTQPQSPLTSAPNNFRTPRKSPNPKIFGIGAAVVAVLAIVAIVLLLPKETPVRAGEFNDNASSSREVEEVKTFVALENFELKDPDFSPYDVEEVETKIVDFFTYAFPEISVLTVKDTKKAESSSPAEISDEENPSSTKSYIYTLSSNTGKTFSAEVLLASNLSGYRLTINSGDLELYSYTGGEITKDLFDHTDDSLLNLIFAELPLSGEADGEKFDITYEGDDKERLTLSAVSETETLKNCDAAKSAAVDLVSDLNLGFSGEITVENFVCE